MMTLKAETKLNKLVAQAHTRLGKLQTRSAMGRHYRLVIELERIERMKKESILNRRGGFTLIEVLVVAVIMGIIMWAMSSMLVFNLKMLAQFQEKKDQVESDIPKFCAAGEAGCGVNKKPLLCLSGKSANNTTMACTEEDPCVKNEETGMWMRGSTECDAGVLFL